MENRNRDEFKFLGHVYNSKYEQNYYQEYLQPSLFVEIRSTYTDHAAWLGTYHKVLDLIGDSIQYHNDGSRIRDREKAFERYPLLLENPKEKYICRDMDDNYGRGSCAMGKKPAVTGGVGCVSISIWQHKFTEKSWQNEIKKITSLVPFFEIRMPVDQFADGQSFLNWVLSLDLLQSPTLFSATAGYRMEQYSGYVNQDAQKNWRQFWMNVLSEDAFPFYPDGKDGIWEAAQKWPELTLHDLPHGFVVQAGKEPGIGDNGRAPEAYYSAGKLLETFSRHLSPRTIQFLDHREWALQFYTPERLKEFEDTAIAEASAYIE